jgi:hypothetical protein
MVDKQKHTTQESVAVKRPLTLSGTVLSTAMNKTIVVRVENKFKHPVVGKSTKHTTNMNKPRWEILLKFLSVDLFRLLNI